MNEHQNVSCFNRGKTSLYTIFFVGLNASQTRCYDWSDHLSIKLPPKGQFRLHLEYIFYVLVVLFVDFNVIIASLTFKAFFLWSQDTNPEDTNVCQQTFVGSFGLVRLAFTLWSLSLNLKLLNKRHKVAVTTWLDSFTGVCCAVLCCAKCTRCGIVVFLPAYNSQRA